MAQMIACSRPPEPTSKTFTRSPSLPSVARAGQYADQNCLFYLDTVFAIVILFIIRSPVRGLVPHNPILARNSGTSLNIRPDRFRVARQCGLDRPWENRPCQNFKISGRWIQPPESEHPDRSIKCVDCSENFIWTSGGQAFHDKGLKNEPKRCKPCKQAKNERLAAITAAQTSSVRQRVEVFSSVLRAVWAQQTTVPFYPSQGRPVCRSCFLAGRASEANSSASA